MLKLLTRFSKKEWLLILVAVAFIAVGVWLDLLLPEFTGKIANAITPDRLAGGIITGEMADIWINGAWMLACTVGSVVTVVIVSYITARVSASYSARVRSEIFEKVNSFGTEEMKKFSVASLITRSTNDVTHIRMFIAMGMQMLIKAPITAVWGVIKIWGKSVEMSIVTGIVAGVMIIVIVFLMFLVLPKFKKIQILTDKVNQVARENLTGIRVVRAYNAEQHEQEKFEGANEDLTANNLFTSRAMGFMMPFMSLLMSGLGLAVWWMSAHLFNIGTLDKDGIGIVIEAQQYAFQIIFAFIMVIMIFIIMPRVMISARRIMEVLKVAPSIVDPAHSPETHFDEKEPTEQGEIEFNNVAFKYPDAEEYVLRDINVKIAPGTTVAFIGSTGSGKSTLVNLLPRLYDATEGEILLDGRNVRDMTLEQLHDKVGYIPQTAVVFKGTIKSNIAFGTIGEHEISDEQVTRALEIAQASEFVSKMQGGIDAEVSQGGKNLSGGQKQRLAIARVVARRPRVFIFDDTFSALDYKTDKALRESLKKECAGSTVLIVAQRIGTIMNADNIVVLDEGRIVGQGTHKELLKSCEVYREIAYSQLSKEELK